MNYALLTLLFALFCRVLYKKEQINWKDALAFLIIGIIVFPIKYAYLPFCIFATALMLFLSGDVLCGLSSKFYR